MGRGRHAGVRARGGSIQIDFRWRGQRCRETLRLEPTPKNLRYAANLRAEILRRIETGSFRYGDYFPDSPRAELDRGGSTLTVAEAMRRYLAAIRPHVSHTTIRDYESAFRSHIEPGLGHIRLRDLTTAHIREWMAGMECGPKRINNVLIPLRGMLKDAFADGLIERDPAARIRAMKVRQDEPDPFTREEQAAILAALPEVARNMFRFAFWTGLRTGELIALEWRDVDFQTNTVRVRRSESRGVVKRPKSASGERDVDLLPPAIEALQAQKPWTFLAEHGRVWINPKDMRPWKWDSQVRQYCWERALKKAGVRYRPPYQTRHTYASMMLSAGANPLWVARQMGHKDWGMIRKRYGRWIPQEQSEAERIAAKLCDQIVTKREGSEG